VRDKIPRNIFIYISLSLVTGCSNNEPVRLDQQSIQEIKTPAGKGSKGPNLVTGDDGYVYLSWIEPDEEKDNMFKFSSFKENAWSQPGIITQGDDWFVSESDYSFLAVRGDGSMAAHWLPKTGEDYYAYDINITQSSNGGKTWDTPFSPHNDGVKWDHGFVSMLPWDENRFFITWLDGRNNFSTKEMMLRYALFDNDGLLYDEQAFDNRVCDCCQTSAVRTKDGAVVVYRDRSEEEVRDISYIRYYEGAWTEPQTLYKDDWVIKGCPVNGPSVAALDEIVAVAWYTGVNLKPEVKVIFSKDEGENFGQPVVVDDGRPIGRVDVIILPDGTALVSWLEITGRSTEIRVRRVYPNGMKDASFTLEKAGGGSASGWPQMEINNDEIIFAWTDAESPSTIRSAAVKLIKF
jgi:hypothetical protein